MRQFWKSVAGYLCLGCDTHGYPCQRFFSPQNKCIFYHGSLFYYAHGEDRLGKLMDGGCFLK